MSGPPSPFARVFEIRSGLASAVRSLWPAATVGRLERLAELLLDRAARLLVQLRELAERREIAERLRARRTRETASSSRRGAGAPGSSFFPSIAHESRSRSTLSTGPQSTPRMSSISGRVIGWRYARIASVSICARVSFTGRCLRQVAHERRVRGVRAEDPPARDLVELHPARRRTPPSAPRGAPSPASPAPPRLLASSPALIGLSLAKTSASSSPFRCPRVTSFVTAASSRSGRGTSPPVRFTVASKSPVRFTVSSGSSEAPTRALPAGRLFGRRLVASSSGEGARSSALRPRRARLRAVLGLTP